MHVQLHHPHSDPDCGSLCPRSGQQEGTECSGIFPPAYSLNGLSCLDLQDVLKPSVLSLESAYNFVSNMENSEENANMTKGIGFCIKAQSTTQRT